MSAGILFFVFLFLAGCIEGEIQKSDIPVRLGFLEGHFKPSNQILVSPSGKYLLTASGDYSAKLWDIKTKKALHTFKNHSGEVLMAIYSNDEKLVLTATEYGKVNLFDMVSGDFSRSFLGHKDSISSIEFSKDNNKILTSSLDGSVGLFERHTGKKLWTFKGHTKGVTAAHFNKDDSMVVTAGRDGNSFVVETNSGKILKTIFKDDKYSFNFLSFSPDYELLSLVSNQFVFVYNGTDFKKLHEFNELQGSYISDTQFHPRKKLIAASGYWDKKIFLFDSETGLVEETIEHDKNITSLDFSKDGKFLVFASQNYSPAFYDYGIYSFDEKKIVYLTEEQNGLPTSPAVLDDGKLIVTNWGLLDEFDFRLNKEKEVYGSNLNTISDLRINPDKSILHYLSSENSMRFDLNNNWEIKSLNLDFLEPAIDVKSNYIVGYKPYDSINRLEGISLYDISENRIKWVKFSTDFGFQDYLFSKDSDIIIEGTWFESDNVRDAKSGLVLRTFGEVVQSDTIYGGNGIRVDDTYKSDSGYFLLTGETFGKGISLLSLQDEKVETIINSNVDAYVDASNQFVNDSIVLLATMKKEVFTYNLSENCIVQNYVHNDIPVDMEISPDSTKLLVGYENGTVKLYDFDSGASLKDLKLKNEKICLSRFSSDGNYFLIGCTGGLANIYDTFSGEIIASIKTGGNRVTHIQYDSKSRSFYIGTQNGILLRYNLDTEDYIKYFFLNNDSKNWVHLHSSGLFDASPEAMKLMYWTKGLEVIEFEQLKDRYWLPGLWKKVMAGENLPDVRDMGEYQLTPEINLGEIKNGRLPIHLTKREGGYGKVSVFLNGKRIIDDARGSDFDSTQETQTIYLKVNDHPYLIDGDNEIEVKASGKDEYFGQGRGAKAVLAVDKDEVPEPQFFGVVLGINEYANAEINLKYPVQDANSIFQAVKKGASNLFDSERTFMYKLTSEDELKPTKQNIEITFKEIAEKANAEDIIFIYMAGHGITWGGLQGDFHYLTSDATSADKEVYNDKVIRDERTVSTEDLKRWLKDIAAQKRVMVIDACGSGKAVENLKLARNDDPSKKKALDRMADDAGTSIISGSAADAVSYESSRFGQGLLTYTILQGMRGAQQLEDNKLVDIIPIMSFAEKAVPKLAKSLGGIQQPDIFLESGAVYIGMLDKAEREEIPLAKPKEVFVRSSFLSGDTFDDELNLTQLVDKELSSISARGVDADLVFFDTPDFPDSCKLSGIYKQTKDGLELQVKQKCGASELKSTIKAKDSEILVEQIMNFLKE